jgi:hypothetical protein
MLPYLKLRARLLHRHLTDFGFPSWAGVPAVALGFAGLCALIYARMPQPGWVICGTALAVLSQLSDKGRLDFLRVTFTRRRLRQIRLAENALLALPFGLALALGLQLWPLVALALGAPLLSLVSMGRRGNWVVPTPFGRWPFEYVVGFRWTFWLPPLLGFVTYQAIKVDNANLGIAVMAVWWLVMASFHQRAEHEHFVLLHKGGITSFLRGKITIAALASNALSLPFALATCIAWPSNSGLVVVAQLAGTAFVVTWLLAKYAHYPEPLGLLPSLVLLAAVLCPPVMLLLIPHFYSKAKTSLTPYLA